MAEPLHPENVLELISATRASCSNFVTIGLALGLTYCRTANLTKCREKRRRLLTLAREALTTAERHMELAPFETHTDIREAAEHLRSEIAKLQLNS